jgi:hypothetical protein
VGSTAEVKGSRAWLLPVVDFGVAIGLVVGFLLDVVLRQGRCLVGRGDHISSCVGAGTWTGLLVLVLVLVLVLEEGSERKSTGADGDVMYTWPCEPYSPHKHDRIPLRSLRGSLWKDDRAWCACRVGEDSGEVPTPINGFANTLPYRFLYFTL